MRHVLAFLREAGIQGIDMATGNGDVYRCHPIFSIFIGNYPEQILVTCLKNGECPTCPIPQEDLGSGEMQELWDLAVILEALDSTHLHPTNFAQAYLNAGIKPIYHPFWYYELTLSNKVDGEGKGEVRRGQLEGKSNNPKRVSVNEDRWE